MKTHNCQLKTANCQLLFLILFALLLVACKKDMQIEPQTPEVTENKIEVAASTAHFEWTVEYPGAICSMVKLSLKEDMSDAANYGNDSISDKKAFSATATGLTRATKYYYCYETWNPLATYTSEVRSFTTKAVIKPTVTTFPITNITITSATCGGEVTDDGGAEVTERGVCWRLSPNPTINDSLANSGTGTGAFTVDLTGLTEGTTYYVRAYAVNSEGTSYGEEKSFTAQAINKPTVTTSSITNISFTSATGNGEVTDDGGAEVTVRGICWSTSPNPTMSDSHANSGNGMGSYTVNMTGLADGTTYYVRAYAVNSKGTGYGEEKSFTTQLINKPAVTTSSITNITSSSATGGGEVTDDGGGEVTERGICWSTSQNPTVSGSHANSGTGTGVYTVDMTGLAVGTTYYVRAYAVNSKGTGYGEEKSFTTEAITKPTVTTSSITNIAYTSATCGGEVTDDGGAEVTERGICWSTSQNPTVSDSHVNSGTGTGEFTVDMTGLTDSVTYYVRAYAVNIKGTGYGEEKSFTTQVINKPTVITSSITNITSFSAVGGGEVTDDGGAEVTERGICWSTSQNPTVSDSHANSGTGTGEFTVDMTGLTEGTIYYVRAYATNSKGTGYGNEESFNPHEPGVITAKFSVGMGKKVYFSQGNLQYQASTVTWRFANHQYDYIGESNANISSGYIGWIDLFGWGTSGYNFKYPYMTSTNSGDYGDGNSSIEETHYDWGVHNAISNGGNQAGLWRTLTKSEWVYVFNTRTTYSNIRYAKACVNDVNGVILLPDNWNSSYYSLSNTNSGDASFNSNIISASQWETLEQHGAVFLPAAGSRIGTSVNNVGSFGYYWSASYFDSHDSNDVYFDSSVLLPEDYCGPYHGFSVRLVRSAP